MKRSTFPWEELGNADITTPGMLLLFNFTRCENVYFGKKPLHDVYGIVVPYEEWNSCIIMGTYPDDRSGDTQTQLNTKWDCVLICEAFHENVTMRLKTERGVRVIQRRLRAKLRRRKLAMLLRLAFLYQTSSVSSTLAQVQNVKA